MAQFAEADTYVGSERFARRWQIDAEMIPLR